MDDENRWSFRRDDILRSAAFLAAVVVCGAGALALRSIESSSSRAFALLFTSLCLTAGAALGLVLSLVELVRGGRVERTGAGLLGAAGVERPGARRPAAPRP